MNAMNFEGSKVTNLERETRELEDNFHRSGGFGLFQVLSHITIILGVLSGSTILYNLQYFQMQPFYLCMDPLTQMQYQCTKNEICNSQVEWTVDYSREESLINWTQQLNLYCASNSQLGLIGSMFFIGSFLGSLILPRMADIYGRKPIFYFGLLLYAATAVCYPFSTSLTLNYLLIFLGGISESGRYYVGFVYLQEIVPIRFQTQIGLNIFTVHGFAKLFYDFYFYQFTKNWIYLSYISIILVFLCLSSFLWLPESPRFLYSSGQYQKAKDSFKQIAMINSITNKNVIILDEKSSLHEHLLQGNGTTSSDQSIQVQNVQKTEKISKLFTESRYRLNILIMIVSWSCSSFCFYLIPYFISSINTSLASNKLNVFQLSIFQTIGEILACIFTVTITSISKSNKKSLVFSFGLAALGSAGFWLVQNAIDSEFLIYYFLISKFGITAAFNISYAIMQELFPTLLKATSFGICNIFARLITILAPMIALIDQPYPMIIFCIFCISAGVLSIFLKPIY